ncbi:MAG: recombinase family protein [Bacteroidetes bacterium]|nr:recombinase family protein [Bacteroidota bacterium]
MSQQTKVCLFIRVSTQVQDYDRQISDLTEYCKQKGYTISKTIATKITGTKTLVDRQDLQELLNAANQNEFQKVILTEISRIGRNARDIRNTIDQLHRKIAVVLKISVVLNLLMKTEMKVSSLTSSLLFIVS